MQLWQLWRLHCFMLHLVQTYRLQRLRKAFNSQILLPSSAQAPAQAGLSWLYSQLIQPPTPTPTHPPTHPGKFFFSTVDDISSLWNHPWLLTSDPVPFDHATFVHATFVHATSVRATFVHATSVRATFFHTTFVQGQNLVAYNCNHSCLDQTIKF